MNRRGPTIMLPDPAPTWDEVDALRSTVRDLTARNAALEADVAQLAARVGTLDRALGPKAFRCVHCERFIRAHPFPDCDLSPAMAHDDAHGLDDTREE